VSIQEQIVDALAQVATALERDHELQRTVLTVTQNANRLRGNRPQPIGTGGRILAWGGPGRLVGWTIAAGATAVNVTFRDSHDNTGPAIAGPVNVPANTSKEFAVPAGGAGFGEALFVDADQAFTGVAWIGADS